MSVSQQSYSRIRKVLSLCSGLDLKNYSSINELPNHRWVLSFLEEIYSEIRGYYTENGICIDPELAENDIKILGDIKLRPV